MTGRSRAHAPTRESPLLWPEEVARWLFERWNSLRAQHSETKQVDLQKQLETELRQHALHKREDDSGIWKPFVKVTAKKIRRKSDGFVRKAREAREGQGRQAAHGELQDDDPVGQSRTQSRSHEVRTQLGRR